MTSLEKLSLASAKNHASFEEYLDKQGYQNFNKTLSEMMRIQPPVESLYQAGTGSELINMLPSGVEKANKLILITDYYTVSQQKSGYYFEFDSKDSALQMQSTLTNAIKDGIVLNDISDNKLLIGVYMEMSTPDQPTTSRRSLSLSSIISTSGKHNIEIAPYNKYGEGPRAGKEVDIQGYSYTKDQGVIHFYYKGKDVTEILSCGSSIEVVLTAMDKMLPESIIVNNVGNYTYTRYDSKQQGFITVSEPKGEVSFIFGELPNYEVTLNKFTLQTTDGKVKQSFETEFSNWKDFASNSDMFEYGDEVKCVIDGVAYVVNELTVDGKHVPVTGDAAIKEGETYYLINSKSYSFILTDTNGTSLGYFKSNVDDWTTFANNEDNAFSIDTESPEQHIVYNPGDGTYVVQYENANGVTVLVKAGDKISASNTYKIPYVMQKSITFEIVNGGSRTINTTANTFAELANELDYITADEGSEYVTYLDTKTQITYKLGNPSMYSLYKPSALLSSGMIVACLTDEDIANGPPVSFTLETAPTSDMKLNVTTNTNKWSIYVAQEDNDFSIDDEGSYIKYQLGDDSYYIGTKGKMIDGVYNYNKVNVSDQIRRTTYFVVTDSSLLA